MMARATWMMIRGQSMLFSVSLSPTASAMRPSTSAADALAGIFHKVPIGCFPLLGADLAGRG